MACVGSNSVLGVTLFWIVLGLGRCNGKVYKVGDSAGWTTLGNVDYKHWTTNHTFLLGDVVVFSYNPKFHNVMQVTHNNYKTCNATSPVAVHTTGNDNVTVSNHGHHFFICGIPGHCQSGQKVDINVLRSVSSNHQLIAPTSAPLAAVTANSHLAPSPSPVSHAPASIGPEKFVSAMVVLMFLVYWLN